MRERGILLENKNKGFSKKMVWIAIIAVILIAGGIAASTLLSKDAKEQYFLAEYNSAKLIEEAAETRYSDEFDWAEEVKETPSESSVDISAEFNDPSGFDSTGMQDIINNATISLNSSIDPKNKEMGFDLSANVAEIAIDDIEFYVTDNKMLASLPFLNQFLQVKEEDIGNFLYQIDPMTFTGEEEVKFDSFFDQTVMSEEDIEHFQNEYMKMIYQELPEDAFTTEDESVDVNGEKLKTSKITLNLSEEKVKDIIEKVLIKAEKDDKLKDIIENQATLDPISYTSNDVSQMLEDFEAAIVEVREGLDDFKIPNGLTSTLWIKDDLVVKRDFSIEMGPTDTELAEFTLTGTQLFTKENQVFDYQLGINDEYEDISMSLIGDLSWKDNVASDQITFSAEGIELVYTGNEELNNGTRDFDRRLAFKEDSTSTFELIWNGASTYENDQANAEHHFSLTGEGISEDDFQLNINTDQKLVKSLDIDTDSMEIVDLGSMNADELENYMIEDLGPQFQEWMMNFYGSMYDTGMGF